MEGFSILEHGVPPGGTGLGGVVMGKKPRSQAQEFGLSPEGNGEPWNVLSRPRYAQIYLWENSETEIGNTQS